MTEDCLPDGTLCNRPRERGQPLIRFNARMLRDNCQQMTLRLQAKALNVVYEHPDLLERA